MSQEPKDSKNGSGSPSKDWLKDIHDTTWFLNVCNNCNFVLLYQDAMRFGKCPRCQYGLLYFVQEVQLSVSEPNYLAHDIPPTNSALNQAIDNDKNDHKHH